MTAIPNPGSVDARRLGCVCPILDNNRGEFAPFPSHDEQPRDEWWCRDDCPLHATEKWSQREAPPDATCADCGHRHAGIELAHICVGCPCPNYPGSEHTIVHDLRGAS